MILLLNFFIRNLFSYLLSLTACLNSCTNSSIILLPYSNFFNSATFTDFSFLSLNFFLISTKNSSIVSYSNNPSSKSSNVFFFYTSADSPYIYTITNSKIFNKVPSNTCSLVISVLVIATASSSPILSYNTWSWACSTASYFYCCWAKSSKLIESCWLIV